MPSSSRVSWRLAFAFAVLTALVLLVVLVYVQIPILQKNGVSSGILDIPAALTSVLGFGLFAYAAYWSFSIRRALWVPLYRRQALGIGLIALYEAFGDPFNHLLIGEFGLSYLPVFLIIGAIGNVLWFYWIDVSLLAGRRSDPMLRDTFRWRKTRKIVWPVLFVFLAVPVVITSYYSLVQNWAFLGKIFSIAGSLSAPANLYINSYGWIFAAFTAAALVLTGRRSGDKRIHRQLEWFGAFVLISILVSAAGQTNLFGQGASLLLGMSLLVQSFFIYKAARSLVPTSRIEKVEVS